MKKEVHGVDREKKDIILVIKLVGAVKLLQSSRKI